MATKKQKRERGEQRRKEFFADIRRTGLEAQRKDREHRMHKQRKEWQEQHDKKHSWKKRVKECPLCQDMYNGATTKSIEDTDVKETI